MSASVIGIAFACFYLYLKKDHSALNITLEKIMNSVYVNEMVAHRRHLHKRPEEGWTEFETTYYIVDQLRKNGYPGYCWKS